MEFSLDYIGDVPIYQQLRNQIILGIAAGSLQPGDKLPTIRELAAELEINMMTVSKAYQILRKKGYIHTDHRNGVRVSHQIENMSNIKRLEKALRPILTDAQLGGIEKDIIMALCESLTGLLVQ